MNSMKIKGLLGGLIMLAACFIPIGYVNSDIITIFPVFNNLDLGVGVWLWRDIIAFAITIGILSVLAIAFSVKKWGLGLIVTGVLSIIVSLFMLLTEWIAQLRADKFNDVDFSYGIGWLILVIGIVLVISEGAMIQKETKKTA